MVFVRAMAGAGWIAGRGFETLHWDGPVVVNFNLHRRPELSRMPQQTTIFPILGEA